ncbi:NAD(P)-binding protein [Sistotremastrum niveocremeum HHB9708]|uniref:NAD(P)-binding protein n=1 Tax=Sistotremastrum niveocremeum HHB9708 TaxID=1314777 RepID=A0A164W1P2_9AGAM|nr:NAD(P)-binding protein [Sistotremastrum niveocremeum HHB9708]
MKIILTGTTGKLGSRVLAHIQALLRDTTHSLIISVYNPDKGPELADRTAYEIRRGNFSQPASLDSAFKGGDILLLISYPSIANELRVKNHKNAIDAAIRQGVKHIFYTSLAFAGPPSSSSSSAAVMQAHLSTEAYLRSTLAKTEIKYTIIREGLYTESWPLYLGFVDPKAGEREAIVPESGGRGIAWAKRDELGEATARLIVDAANAPSGFAYADKTILLTGPRALSLEDTARIISKHLTHPFVVRTVSVEEFVRPGGKMHEKLGEEWAGMWATTYGAIAEGETDVVDETLEKILGRKPESVERTLETEFASA